MARILWHSYALFMSKFKYIIWEVILEVWVKLYPRPVNSEKFHPRLAILGCGVEAGLNSGVSLGLWR